MPSNKANWLHFQHSCKQLMNHNRVIWPIRADWASLEGGAGAAVGFFRQRVKRGAAAMSIMRQTMCLLKSDTGKPVRVDIQTKNMNLKMNICALWYKYCKSVYVYFFLLKVFGVLSILNKQDLDFTASVVFLNTVLLLLTLASVYFNSSRFTSVFLHKSS